MDNPIRPPTHKGMFSAKKTQQNAAKKVHFQNDKFHPDAVHASSKHDLPEDKDGDEEMMDVDTSTRNPFQNTKYQAQGREQPPFSTPTPQHFFPPGSTSESKTRTENKCTTKGMASNTDMSELLTAFNHRENHHLSKKFPGLQIHRGRGLSARNIFMHRRAGGKPKDIITHPRKRGIAMPRYPSLRGNVGFRGQLAWPKRVKSEGMSVGSSWLRDRLVKRRQLKQQKREENEVTAMFQGLGIEDGDDERKMDEE